MPGQDDADIAHRLTLVNWVSPDYFLDDAVPLKRGRMLRRRSSERVEGRLTAESEHGRRAE
jgi:hypothetical protein